MVELYATLIIHKRRKFEQVPEKFKEAVKAALERHGYDITGSKTEKEG